MRKRLLLTLIFLTALLYGQSQNLSIKGSIFGIPLGSAGTYLGHAGFEYRLPSSRHSLEIIYSLSGWGGISSDGPEPKRRWYTAAFQQYLGKKEIRNSPFLSYFVEAGNRKISPGFVHYSGDSILNGERANEIAPGISFGKNFRLGKRWVIQSQIGPKIIFARYTTTYYHSISSTFTEQKHNEIKAGMRFQFSFCYQL
jgi:hypothetical protein